MFLYAFFASLNETTLYIAEYMVFTSCIMLFRSDVTPE
jgi:hypothetical protein